MRALPRHISGFASAGRASPTAYSTHAEALQLRRSHGPLDPLIHEAVASLRTDSAVVDGEALWCDGDGLAIFDKLRSRPYDGEVILSCVRPARA